MNKGAGTRPQSVGRASARAVTKDRLSKSHRSWNMSRIRGKDTTPEVAVRQHLHKMGYRFRLHVRIPIPADFLSAATGERIKVRCRSLRSVPELKTQNSKLKTATRPRSVSVDILLPKYKTVIFVHGCFWHRHKG